MKYFFSILTIAVFFTLFNSCKKEEDSLLTPKPDIADGQILYHYILDGVDYSVVMEQKEDGGFDVASVIDERLTKALDFPNSTLLQDPFNKCTYYVYRSEEESREMSAEIVRHMNQCDYLSKSNTLSSRGGEMGYFVCYSEKNFVSPFITQMLDPNSVWSGPGPRGYSNLGANSDVMSSYKVYYDTRGAREDQYRFVISFHQDEGFRGRVLTAYGNFMNWQPGDQPVAWKDANMHSTLMQGGWKKKYWGDNVSSISWVLLSPWSVGYPTR